MELNGEKKLIEGFYEMFWEKIKKYFFSIEKKIEEETRKTYGKSYVEINPHEIDATQSQFLIMSYLIGLAINRCKSTNFIPQGKIIGASQRFDVIASWLSDVNPALKERNPLSQIDFVELKNILKKIILNIDKFFKKDWVKEENENLSIAVPSSEGQTLNDTITILVNMSGLILSIANGVNLQSSIKDLGGGMTLYKLNGSAIESFLNIVYKEPDCAGDRKNLTIKK